MQRIDPRPVETPSQAPQQEGQQQQSQQSPAAKSWNLPTGFASTGRDPHTQSFEEIYGVPENFLEIEVRQEHAVAILYGLRILIEGLYR